MTTPPRLLVLASLALSAVFLLAAWACDRVLEAGSLRSQFANIAAGLGLGILGGLLAPLEEAWRPIIPWDKQLALSSLTIFVIAKAPFASWLWVIFQIEDVSNRPRLLVGVAIISMVLLNYAARRLIRFRSPAS